MLSIKLKNIIIRVNDYYSRTHELTVLYRLYNVPKDFGGSDRTQSADEHNSPCCIKTMGLGTSTSTVDLPFPWGILCIVKIYPSSVVTI